MGLHVRKRHIVHCSHPESAVGADPSVIQPAGDAFGCRNGMEETRFAAVRIEDDDVHATSDDEFAVLAKAET